MALLSFSFAPNSESQDANPELLWSGTNVVGRTTRVDENTFRSVGNPFYPDVGPSRAQLIDQNGVIFHSFSFDHRGDVYPGVDGIFELNSKPVENGMWDYFLTKHSPTTGKPLWNSSSVGRAWWPSMTPFFRAIPQEDGSCIVITGANSPQAPEVRHFSASGALVFHAPTISGAHLATAKICADGYLFAGSSGGDFLLWKVAPDGMTIWSHKYGGVGSEGATAMVVTPDEKRIVLGGTSDSRPSGSKTAPHHGDSDHWIVCVDGSGQKLWDASFGDQGPNDLRDLALVGKALVSASGRDALLVHDLKGNLVSQHKTAGAWAFQIIAANSAEFFFVDSDLKLHKYRLDAEPRIVGQPSNKAVLEGSSAQFHVAVSSLFEPAALQWFHGERAIEGATNSTLTLPMVSHEHLGAYSVSVSNSVASVRSRSVLLAFTDAEVEVEMRPSLRIKGLINRDYIIERSGFSPQGAEWEVADTITITNSPQIWVDADLTLQDRRLYRVRLAD